MSDQPQELGPNYDWKHEAEHYSDEADKLRALLRKVEVSSDERLALAETQIKELRTKVRAVLDYFDPDLTEIVSEELAKLSGYERSE